MKKFISWNVNGLRACIKKDCFYEFIKAEDPDAVCLQETKLQEGQLEVDLPGYHQYWNYEYYLITVYTPNSQDQLARLDYRMTWEDDFLAYVKGLSENKPVIYCGDLNVAHKEIDLKNPSTNRRNAGFTDEERAKMTTTLESGFTDTFRFFYPDLEKVYSWWSYRFRAREKNAGWRIDYFIVSDSLQPRLKDAKIYTDVMGSDHCPVGLILE